jgi:hypothetical protein
MMLVKSNVPVHIEIGHIDRLNPTQQLIERDWSTECV